MSETERAGYHHGDLRAALLHAAEAELSASGPEGFSLRACARRAGVSHAAPKHHFGSADGLLDALAARGFRRLSETMERHREGEAPPGRLLASGRGYVAFARDHPALFKLLFGARRTASPSQELAAAGAQAFAILSEGVAAASRGGSAGAPALDLAAAWSLVHGLAHLLLEAPPAIGALLGGAPSEAAIRAVLERPLPVGGAS